MSNPLTNLVRRVGEALTPQRSALFLTTTEKVMGVSPEVSFKTMTSVYLGDLAARASIGFLADQIAGTGSFWVDNLFFNSVRWSASYGAGSRKLTETDEELHSDNECLLRAKAFYNHLSSPAEYVRVVSDVIDYGTAPILAGDKIWVTLPNENVDGYYRVISVEYRLIAETQTLETTLELGKELPLLADYLYSLRSRTGSLSRYKIGRI